MYRARLCTYDAVLMFSASSLSPPFLFACLSPPPLPYFSESEQTMPPLIWYRTILIIVVLTVAPALEFQPLKLQK